MGYETGFEVMPSLKRMQRTNCVIELVQNSEKALFKMVKQQSTHALVHSYVVHLRTVRWYSSQKSIRTLEYIKYSSYYTATIYQTIKRIFHRLCYCSIAIRLCIPKQSLDCLRQTNKLDSVIASQNQLKCLTVLKWGKSMNK